MNKRLLLLLVCCLPLALSLCGCVLPYMDGYVKVLLVEPKQYLYPLNYHFYPTDELNVSAVDSLGDIQKIPVEQTQVFFQADFTLAGEKTGVVEYQEKIAVFTIAVYDPNMGPPQPQGPVIIFDD